jgi:uncharacterized protein (TIGR03067 family)
MAALRVAGRPGAARSLSRPTLFIATGGPSGLRAAGPTLELAASCGYDQGASEGPPVRHSKRWLVSLAAVLTTAFAPIPPPKARPDPVKEELKRLQGRWEHVIFNRNGQKEEQAAGRRADVVKGDELAVVWGEAVISRWSVTVDPSKRPKAMDLSHKKNSRRLLCVYKLEGDTLTVCWKDEDKATERPRDFTARKGVIVQVLRKKP